MTLRSKVATVGGRPFAWQAMAAVWCIAIVVTTLAIVRVGVDSAMLPPSLAAPTVECEKTRRAQWEQEDALASREAANGEISKRARAITVLAKCTDEVSRPIMTDMEITFGHAVAWQRGDTDGQVSGTLECGAVDTVPAHLECKILARGYAAVYRSRVFQELPMEDLRWDLGTIVLLRAAVVKGLVVDELGSPIPGAMVFATRSDIDLADNDRFRLFGVGLRHLVHENAAPEFADDAGRFIIESLPQIPMRIVAHADGREWRQSPVLDATASGCAYAQEIVLPVLSPLDSIAGWARDEDNRGVDATISLYDQSDGGFSDRLASVIASKEDGSFSVTASRREIYNLRADFGAARGGCVELGGIRGGSHDLVVRSHRPVAVRVMVVDLMGQVVKDALVVALDSRGAGLVVPWAKQPGGELLATLPKGRIGLQISAPGFKCRGLLLENEGVGDQVLRVELEASLRISGRVVKKGVAVPCAKVHAHFLGGLPPQGMRFSFIGAGLGSRLPSLADGGNVVTSDALGEFTLDVPNAGWFVLHADGQLQGHGESMPVLVDERSQLSEPRTIELSEGCEVRGKVLGLRLEDAQPGLVYATCGDGHILFCDVYPPEFSYRFADIPAGAWKLQYASNEVGVCLRTGRTIERVISDESCDIVLRPGTSVAHDIDMGGRVSLVVATPATMMWSLSVGLRRVELEAQSGSSLALSVDGLAYGEPDVFVVGHSQSTASISFSRKVAVTNCSSLPAITPKWGLLSVQGCVQGRYYAVTGEWCGWRWHASLGSEEAGARSAFVPMGPVQLRASQIRVGNPWQWDILKEIEVAGNATLRLQ